MASRRRLLRADAVACGLPLNEHCTVLRFHHIGGGDRFVVTRFIGYSRNNRINAVTTKARKVSRAYQPESRHRS